MTDWLLPLLRDRLIRLVWMVPVGAFGLFALVSLAPIDPVQSFVGAKIMQVGPGQREAIAAAWGLNEPFGERFLRWAGNALAGDFGNSITYNAPVLDIIRDRFPASLALIAAAFAFSFVLGLGLGTVAAATRGRWQDRIIRGFAVMLASSPGFWVALLLVAVFAVGLNWLPACCASPPGLQADEATLGQRLWHMILPAISLSIVGIAPLILHTRQSMIAFLESPAGRHLTAHGWGSLRLAFGPGLRHALGCALTVHLAGAGELFGGSVLAETVFAWPGLGQATVRAASGADAPLLIGIGLATLLFVFAGNLAADIAARLLDPRLARRNPA